MIFKFSFISSLICVYHGKAVAFCCVLLILDTPFSKEVESNVKILGIFMMRLD